MIEAVIRLEGGDKYQNESKRDAGQAKSGTGHAGVIKLVDSQNNQFVLSRAKDNTLPVEDHNLIQVNDVIGKSVSMDYYETLVECYHDIIIYSWQEFYQV